MKIFKFRFNYKKDEAYPNYKEYDGYEFNAPDEDEAWKIFLGISGEFKMPERKNYDIEKIGLAYEFNGDLDQWKNAVKDGDVE